MNTPIVRPATVQDLAEIVTLCAEHAQYEEAEYNAEGKAAQLESSLFSGQPQLHCLIAQVADETAGYATFMEEFSTWDADFYIHMDCLFVRPAFRGFGIGEKLVQEIARYAMERGRLIQWQTPASNERAIRFYHRLGAASKQKVRFFSRLGSTTRVD